jgi:tetratricopeptide (TPR) repeat protein
LVQPDSAEIITKVVEHRPHQRLEWGIRMLLAGTVFVIFWPALRAGFVNWDDGLNIVDNPHLGFTWEKLKWMFTDTDYTRRYYPLGVASYSVDWQFFGGSPFSYHLGNLLLHALNTLLVFGILQRVIRLCLAKVDQTHAMLAAGLGGLWWAAHPLRAEPVCWASSRIYCVAALFFFLSIHFYLRQSDRTGPRRSVAWAALFFGLSLLSYPIALGGVAVFVLLDVFVLKRLSSNPAKWLDRESGKVLMEKLLFCPAAALMFGVNFWSRLNHPSFEPVVTLSDFSAPARVVQAFWLFAWYTWKPWLPFHLAPKYPDLLSDAPFSASYIAAIGLVAALTAFLFLRRRATPALWAAWLCQLALLLPFIGVTEHPHHTYDRYSYIAGVVWAAVLAAALISLLQFEKRRTLVLPAFLALCVFLAVLAREQTHVWQSSLNVQSAMSESLGRHPERVKHDVVVASELLSSNRPQEAEARLRFDLELKPDSAEAWGALGNALSDQHRTEEAISSYERALQLKPGLESARQNLAVTLAMAGRHEKAVSQFETLLKEKPRNASAHHNLAISLHQLGRDEEARQHLETSRRLRQTSL